MDISKWGFQNRNLVYFLVAVLLAGGALACYQMSKLEDPEIKVKLAMVATTYPGASAHQVELEVTDVLEKSIRKMDNVDNVESYSFNDLSLIQVELLTKELKENYNIVFHDLNLLEQAFTHSSYVNEHRNLQLSDNERLEFLGDAVLELMVSQYLFRLYPHLPEGKLTKTRAAIVREDSLSKFAKECHFDQYVLLGKGEENSGGRTRPALLCDLFEAFLGALYLDQGFDTTHAFIEKVIFPKVKAGAFSHEMDHKTKLQEVLQKSGDVSIEYRLINEEGPAHERVFWIEVYVDDQLIGTGQGKSKKLAEQAAAENALAAL